MRLNNLTPGLMEELYRYLDSLALHSSEVIEACLTHDLSIGALICSKALSLKETPGEEPTESLPN